MKSAMAAENGGEATAAENGGDSVKLPTAAAAAEENGDDDEKAVGGGALRPCGSTKRKASPVELIEEEADEETTLFKKAWVDEDGSQKYFLPTITAELMIQRKYAPPVLPDPAEHSDDEEINKYFDQLSEEFDFVDEIDHEFVDRVEREYYANGYVLVGDDYIRKCEASMAKGDAITKRIKELLSNSDS